MKLNNNIWLNRLLLRATFEMPTSLNDDREIEFEIIRGNQIADLIDFWQSHREVGNLTEGEYLAIGNLILLHFQRQAAELGITEL